MTDRHRPDDPRRHLPGVDVLLSSPPFQELLAEFPRGRVVDAIRGALVAERDALVEEGEVHVPPHGSEDWARRVRESLLPGERPSLRAVVNATGVVLHTNLGRAPLSDSAREAMARAGLGYSNLEFDLKSGERGSRYVHCVELLRELTGAEDALVVNNNAAALVLGLNSMAAGQEVVVSRGELVEIGVGFRIPDMLARSGAVLREVRTTNSPLVVGYDDAARVGRAPLFLKFHR